MTVLVVLEHSPAAPPPPAPQKPTSLLLVDVDGTLVVSKTGRRWAADAEDWVFAFPGVPGALAAARAGGAAVALVTNQGQWGPAAEGKLRSLLAAIAAEAGGWAPPCYVAAGLARKGGGPPSPLRKPGPGLFEALLAREPALRGLPALVVGDAAGEGSADPACRWAGSDAGFAAAVGAGFAEPRAFFGGWPAPAPAPAGGPPGELVLLVGAPGSGKTSTALALAAAARAGGRAAAHLEQDAFSGGHRAVLPKAREALARLSAPGAPPFTLVVDATHPSAEKRAAFAALAAERGLPCRVLWHAANGRPFNEARPPSASHPKPVPEVAFAIYSKYFEEPLPSPGVTVERVN